MLTQVHYRETVKYQRQGEGIKSNKSKYVNDQNELQGNKRDRRQIVILDKKQTNPETYCSQRSAIVKGTEIFLYRMLAYTKPINQNLALSIFKNE